MYLHRMTWPRVEDYLKTNTAILIPIGSTEQHGPTGLIGTDALCPEIIAAEAERQADSLVGPTFNVGCAQHHMAFPGSMTLRPSTMIAALTDWVNSLHKHGFEKIYFLNGHGGNAATMDAAFSEIYAQKSLDRAGANHRPLRCHRQNWWELDGIFQLCKKLFPTGHGSHATPSEVAVTFYGYPECATQRELEPKIAPSGPILDADDYRKRFPDGRIGSDPSTATVELGEQIVKASADSLLKSYDKFIAWEAGNQT